MQSCMGSELSGTKLTAALTLEVAHGAGDQVN